MYKSLYFCFLFVCFWFFFFKTSSYQTVEIVSTSFWLLLLFVFFWNKFSSDRGNSAWLVAPPHSSLPSARTVATERLHLLLTSFSQFTSGLCPFFCIFSVFPLWGVSPNSNSIHFIKKYPGWSRKWGSDVKIKYRK